MDSISEKLSDVDRGSRTEANIAVGPDGVRIAELWLAVPLLAECLNKLPDLAPQVVIESAIQIGARALLSATAISGPLHRENPLAAGLSFEALASQELANWGRLNCGEVYHVGPDNRPGDVLLIIKSLGQPSEEICIVVELKRRTTAAGLVEIRESLERAMNERRAQAGLYITDSSDGLGQVLGSWADGYIGDRPYVATSRESMINAVRWILALLRLKRLSGNSVPGNLSLLDSLTNQLRVSLTRTATMQRSVSRMLSDADDLQSQINALRSDAGNVLAELERQIERRAARASDGTLKSGTRNAK